MEMESGTAATLTNVSDGSGRRETSLWLGTGTVQARSKSASFARSTGMWYLDTNGNGKLDACGVDACVGPFGQPGDLPVAGKW